MCISILIVHDFLPLPNMDKKMLIDVEGEKIITQFQVNYMSFQTLNRIIH